MQDSILAAIDIGTNSIHMVVVRIEPTIPAFTIIAREKTTVRLGDRDLKTRNLTEEAMNRAISALKRCQDLALSLRADHIIATATSATREAGNGQQFLDRINQELGITVDLISGVEEARRIYLGVLSGMEFNQHPHVIIDIGGGSTEMILADSQELRFLSSTKVGAVRLTQDFVHTDPISVPEFEALKAYARGMLERPVEELKAHIKEGEILKLVGTSGTIETLAIIHALDRLKTEPNPLTGYQVSKKDIQNMIKRFAGMTYEQRFNVDGMSDKRAEIIIAGGVILLEAMSLLDLEQIIICERALREGMIVDWMVTHGYVENRMRFQKEIRPRTVLKIAKKYQVNLDHGHRVANFAVNIFDQLQGKLHHYTEEERELLWSASILHNSGIYVSHGSHHKHSYYLIRNAELLGFSETELELMANIARYHRKSTPKKRHESYNGLTPYHRVVVRQLSAILRLAVAFDRRQIGAIASVNCQLLPQQKELHLHLIPKNINDPCTLELWNLEYKKQAFEQEFNLKVIAQLAYEV